MKEIEVVPGDSYIEAVRHAWDIRWNEKESVFFRFNETIIIFIVDEKDTGSFLRDSNFLTIEDVKALYEKWKTAKEVATKSAKEGF